LVSGKSDIVKKFDEKVALGPVKCIPVESATQPESHDHSEKSVIVSPSAETQGAIGNENATAKGAAGNKKATAIRKVPILQGVFLFLDLTFIMIFQQVRCIPDQKLIFSQKYGFHPFKTLLPAYFQGRKSGCRRSEGQ
jgi:hypothetical protein